jgi:hypothetical protein
MRHHRDAYAEVAKERPLPTDHKGRVEYLDALRAKLSQLKDQTESPQATSTTSTKTSPE